VALVGRKAAFLRCLHEAVQTRTGGRKLSFTDEGKRAIQAGVEEFVTDVFRDSALCADHEGRHELLTRDVRLALRLKHAHFLYRRGQHATDGIRGGDPRFVGRSMSDVETDDEDDDEEDGEQSLAEEGEDDEEPEFFSHPDVAAWMAAL